METYTYPETDTERPIEVLLIGSKTDNIGCDNTFEPDGFYGEHITNWLRQRYYILNGRIYAQVPRQTKRYPKEAKKQLNLEKSLASDVAVSDGSVEVYYPVSESECVCLFWNTRVDGWSMSYVNQPVENGNIVTDRGQAQNSKRIWTSPV